MKASRVFPLILPPIPPRAKAPANRYIVLIFSYFFLYNIILSDNGLLLALMGNMRKPELEEVWVYSFKLPLLLCSLGGVTICNFIQLIRKKKKRNDFFMEFACCLYVFCQLIILNISPLQ